MEAWYSLNGNLWFCSITTSNWPSTRNLAVHLASLLTTAHSFYSYCTHGLYQWDTKWAPWNLIHAFNSLREQFNEVPVRLYLPSEFGLPKTDWSNMCCLCNWEEKFLNTLKDILIHVPMKEVITRVITETITFSYYIFVASHFIPNALVVPSAILCSFNSTCGKRNQPAFSFSSSFSLNLFPQMVFFDNIVIYVKSQTTPKKVFMFFVSSFVTRCSSVLKWKQPI